MNLPPLILASASPRRSELLHQLGLEFQVFAGDAEEIQPEHLTPHETCQINAYRKARVVAKRFPDALVLGADTVVCLGTQLYGKPANREVAYQILSALQGRRHEVITGVCLIHLRGHRQQVLAESTDVQFHPLTAEQLKEYLALVNPLDKAGAYAIQEHGDMIVERIEGSYSNVVGLPVEKVRAVLEGWNTAR
jgi:septum formation protein